MKRLIYLSVILLSPLIFLHGQEFTTRLFFEDSKGHKDTITIGYDENATNSIDNIFGEEDINTKPFDSVFDVRISEAYLLMTGTSQFLTKKQIFKKDCNKIGFPETPSILIKCKYYPIKVKWDKSVFNDSCRSYSFITDWYPGGWFDGVSGTEQGPYFMKSKDSSVFSYFTHKYSYTLNNVLVDTVRQLFFCIASHTNISVNTPVLTQNALIVYPNSTLTS